jgi:hypothetical protein
LEGYFSACYTQWVPKSRFDARYFDRFYGERPVRTMNEVGHLAIAVHEMVSWWGGKIRSVLEVGAGPGDWSNWYREAHPSIRVLSVDVSEHACKKYGHAATAALRNLAFATRTCLYFDALTSHDARHTVDRSATDLDAHLRPGSWYRDRLSRAFVQVGGGLWVRKGAPIVLHELERHR